jgi:glucose-1-phosphate thymidylyltransferase
LKIGCLEEIAYRLGLIAREDVVSQAKLMDKSGYGDYLLAILDAE